MRGLIILFALLALTACSQKSAKVKLELTSSFVLSGPVAFGQKADGGLMVWGISDKGDSFSRVLTSSTNIELEIPNGLWTFSAVAWESSTNTALDRDAIRCARSATKDLQGENVAVPLVLTTANCESVNFRGNATSMSSDVNLSLCQDASGVTSITDSCTNDPQSGSRKAGKAPIMSVRLRLPEFDKFGATVIPRGEGLSRCVAMPTGNLNSAWAAPIDLGIPVGDPANLATSPFRTTFELYPASLDCGDTLDAGFSTVTFPNGLALAGANKYFANGNDHYVYLNVPDQQICKGREGLTPFAGGDGSWDYPWLICSATQLYNIHLDATSKADSFRLMTDVNLNPFSKGFSASAPGCWEDGQNWQPIGFDTSCAPIANGFQGSFFGGGHTITGMRMRLGQNNVGFVGMWKPASSGVPDHITDLVFVDSEVEGTSKVGAVVGFKDGGNNGTIGNIEVRGGSVSARKNVNGESFLGGIAGYTTYTDLFNHKTSRVKIEGEGLNIGGIFGFSANASVLRKLVSRSYVGGPEWATIYNVGGIGGYVTSTVLQTGEFAEWASESIVVGRQNVGGLLGDWGSTNQPLKNVYASGSITIRGQSANHLGGLFGKNFNGATINTAYFAGSLLNDADDPTCGSVCNVGWFSGYAQTMSRTNDYVMTENAGGHFSLLQRSGFGDDPDAGGAGAIWGPITISTASVHTPPAMSPMMTSPWVHVLGDKPRLEFEKHPCSADADANNISPRSSLASQKAHWGTATKPMMICRPSQFTEITSHLGSGKIGLIVGALNLGSASAHVKPTVVAGAYLTGEAGYIHGLRREEALASFQWAPFGTISGVLTNTYIAGIDLRGLAGATAASSISAVAVTNNGAIENVQLLTGKLTKDDPEVVLSGLVATNNATMRDVNFQGTLKGDGNMAGLVGINAGTIEDSEASGRLILYNGGNTIGGVSIQNTNTIERVSVKSKLSSLTAVPATATQLGMVTYKNSGRIQDVHVTSEAYWRANFASSQTLGTNEVGQIAGKLETGSVLKRVIVEGFLYDILNSVSLTAGNSNIIGNSLGSISSIFAVPAGRLIAEASPSQITSCPAGGMIINMHSSYVMPSAFNSTSYWEPNMLSNNKLVWAVFDNGNGYFRYAYVTDWDEQINDIVTLSQTCSSLGFTAGTTRVRFVQDFDNGLDGAGANGQLTTPPFVGFTPDNDRFSTANLVDVDSPTVPNTGWNEDIPNAAVADTVIARDADVTTWILPIFGDYLNTGSTTRPLPIWEVEDGDEKIELFRIKK